MFLEGAVRDNRIKADDFGAGIARFTKKRKERFWELDFLRGLCVVLMVFDHFMFNMMDVLPVVNEFFGTTLGRELSKYALVYWKGDFRNTVRFSSSVRFSFCAASVARCPKAISSADFCSRCARSASRA